MKHNLGDQIKRNEMDREYGMVEGGESCIQSFGGEPLWKETFWKSRHRREDNIKMDCQVVSEDVAWHALAQDRHKW